MYLVDFSAFSVAELKSNLQLEKSFSMWRHHRTDPKISQNLWIDYICHNSLSLGDKNASIEVFFSRKLQFLI